MLEPWSIRYLISSLIGISITYFDWLLFYIILNLPQKTGGNVSVAMKMLQPVKPEPGATPSQVQQYEVTLTT